MPVLVTDQHDQFAQVCRQFTETTGWPLHYASSDTTTIADLEQRLHQQHDCCWTHHIEDNVGPRGILYLTLPGSPGQDKFFTAISALAEQIAALMSRVLHVEGGLESRDREVNTLVNLGQTYRGDQPLPEILQHLLAAAVQLTGFRWAAFYLLNPATNRLRLRSAYLIPPDSMPAANREVASSPHDLEALSKGVAVVTRNSLADDRWLPVEAVCGICVSVQTALVPMGTLWIYDRRTRHDLPRVTHVLQAVAGHISSALERVVLLRESESQHRMACELRLASESQGSQYQPVLPESCGFVSAARCISRHEVGGDLCELIPLTDQSTAISVGDASGNSIPAALVMNAVRGALRTVSGRRGAHEWHPSVTMERLNSALHAIIGAQQFMSLCYGVYDAVSRKFTYSNAGHPAAILYRTGQPTELDSHGLLLGVLEEAVYDFSVLEIEPGDVLILYSDGISEAMDDNDVLFGSQGVMRAFEATGSHDVNAVLENIWNTAEMHCGMKSRKKMDDRTLLVLRFL